MTAASWPKFDPVPPTETPVGRSLRWSSSVMKKNTLSFTIGPPKLKPPCLSLKVEIFVSVTPLPTQSWLRPKKNAVPWKSLEPLLVTALMPPPENPPCRTSYGETTSCTSRIASRLIGCVSATPPGAPADPASPNRSLLFAPSICRVL